MSAPEVRLAQAADVTQLVALMTEFYAESGFTLLPGPAARSFAQIIDDPRLGRVWLLGSDGQPAGYVVLTLGFSMEYGGLRGFVDDLFVRPVFRQRGLGSAALGEVRRAAARLGVRALLVEVGADNRRALSVYRRAGFDDSRRLLYSAPMEPPVHAV